MMKDFRPHVLCTDLPAGVGREDAIRTLAGRLDGERAERIIASALARDAEESTYLGRGLAVPHARLGGLDTPLVCLAESAEGVDWQGQRATLIALLVVPEERPELHLALLGTLARHCSTRRAPADLGALAEALRG